MSSATSCSGWIYVTGVMLDVGTTVSQQRSHYAIYDLRVDMSGGILPDRTLAVSAFLIVLCMDCEIVRGSKSQGLVLRRPPLTWRVSGTVRCRQQLNHAKSALQGLTLENESVEGKLQALRKTSIMDRANSGGTTSSGDDGSDGSATGIVSSHC